MIKSVLAVLGVFSIGEDSSFALLVSGASSQDDCWENCGAFVSVDAILDKTFCSDFENEIELEITHVNL